MINLPTNIIIVNDFDYINGGAAKVAIDWARILHEQGHNVCFFSAVHKEQDKIEGVRYISTNQQEFLNDSSKLKGAIRGFYNKKAYLTLKSVLTEYEPRVTIIYVHGWIKALSCSIWNAAKEMGFDVQVTGHDYFLVCPNGGFYDYRKNVICHRKPLSIKCICCNCDSRNFAFKLYRCFRAFIQDRIVKILSKTKRLITISDFSEKILVPFMPKPLEVVRIPNPIDRPKLKKIEHPQKNKYFLFVGRLSKEKGCDLFCQAISELKLCGIVVGDGPEAELLKKRFANSNITFVGWKSKTEVFEYMQKARALVFPSRWYEAAPLTVPEAISIGLPCIVSDCCAAKDNITDSQKGTVFNTFDELKEQLRLYSETL